MNILFIEDDDDKYNAVLQEINSLYGEGARLTRAPTFQLATKNIYENKYDLIIADLMMPMRHSDQPIDVSEDIISLLELSDTNAGSQVIVLSSFSDLVVEQRSKFSDAGIILIGYEPDSKLWRTRIAAAIKSLKERTVFDFLIVCALDKERSALKLTDAKVGNLRNIRGLDCLELEIGEFRGICVKPARMGLVEASIITSRAIERFSPKIVAMCGICAGYESRSPIGTLVIADPCWEYQAGKWADDGFKMEHYDSPLDTATRITLSQYIDTIGKGEDIKRGLIEDTVVFAGITIGPMATGSAVLASAEKMADVEEQQRKVVGLDMEMYGLYKASETSVLRPQFFGAKCVVDHANASKGDKYHEYGCVLSARFVVNAIDELLSGSAHSPKAIL